ncbi:uncharacterized protein L203_105209 [Cryptococcus depauperatus CBS 7841]|uniref:Uncharacterized protein n=1 Tax=Cryptococcus depauperatus CBS 7841 TaxID=1295531 RepID=A0A1E3I0H7_9TREE|nr:hypothetical protein L203_05573 [Cryptococcus depauperatus CBS 7841]
MFVQFSTLALAFAATAQAAISIIYPNHSSIWYKNNTVSLNWTLSDPATDTYFFRAHLSNKDQSILQGNHSIADQTNATSEFVRFLLPQISSAQGYIVTLVNTTNEAQVLATSEEFEIADGNVTSTTTSTSNTATSSAYIPNGKTITSSSSSNPFATASQGSKSSSSPKLDSGIVGTMTQAGMIMVLAGIGMGVAL